MILNRSVIHSCCALLLLGGAIAYPCVARGQEPKPAPDQSAPSAASPAQATKSAHPRGVYRRHAIDDRVRLFSKALDLNEQQQAGVKAILEQQQMRARQIQFDPNISGQERNDRFRALQEHTAQRIRSLLNDEQKQKYDPFNHSTQDASSSGKYLDQWVKNHQSTTVQPPSTQSHK